MINERTIKDYCCEDISLIENYDLAINDKTQIWHCHHRGEVLPCGRFTRDDLKKFNLYYNRPANELIFLTPKEHKALHKNNLGKIHSEETKQKISNRLKGHTAWNKGIEFLKGEKNGMYGKKHSDESKKKMSEACKGKTQSDERKKKTSEAMKLWWQKRKQLCES